APSEEELAAMVPAKKTRKTSDKDPNAPKRAKSAYIFFCAAMRPRVKEELGEEGKSSIMAELGKRWKELKEDDDRADELAEYTKMAADDKARCEKDKPSEAVEKPKKKAVEEEEVSVDEEKAAPKKKAKAKAKTAEEALEDKASADEKKAKAKAALEKASPKKKSGYIYFCKHNREAIKTDNPGMSAQDVTRTLARLWKELKKEQKEWNDSAADEE
ncbi:hypothetical protein EBR66_08800, partial [bacterium]|nr:hypothetical protein [bacterium]